MSSNARMTVNLCPYCGEEDLRPVEHESRSDAWACLACLRTFAVTHLGVHHGTRTGTRS